jgi:hypothetical protein
VVAESSASSGLVVTSVLNAEKWEKLVITVTNNGTDAVDINKGELVYSLPKSISVRYSPKTYAGIAWLAGTDLSISTIRESEINQHHVGYSYPPKGYELDTTLLAGESFSLNVSSSGISEDIYKLHLKDKIKYVLESELPIAQLKINVGAKPSGSSEKTIKVFIRNNVDNSIVNQVVSWDSSYSVLGLREGVSYDVWANEILEDEMRLLPNYLKENSFKFSADSNVNPEINVSYTASEIAKPLVTLNFSGLPDVALVDVKFTSKISNKANVIFA